MKARLNSPLQRYFLNVEYFKKHMRQKILSRGFDKFTLQNIFLSFAGFVFEFM